MFSTKSNFALTVFVLKVENCTVLVAILKGIEVRFQFKQYFVLSVFGLEGFYCTSIGATNSVPDSYR